VIAPAHAGIVDNWTIHTYWGAPKGGPDMGQSCWSAAQAPAEVPGAEVTVEAAPVWVGSWGLHVVVRALKLIWQDLQTEGRPGSTLEDAVIPRATSRAQDCRKC
jgi:hypothetical protein